MRLLILGLVVLLCPAAAVAQDAETRAGQAEQQRAEKAEHLEPPAPGKLESGLYYFEDRYLAERWFNPPRGLFARFGGMPEGQGFTIGPAYRISNYDASFTTSAAVSLKGAWEVVARLEVPRPTTPLLAPGPPRTFFTVGTVYHELPDEDFYGVGQNTSGRRLSYQMDELLVDATGGVAPVKWFTLAGTGEYRSHRPGTGGGNVPSIEQVFDENTAPAFRTDLDFLRVGGAAYVDYTNTYQTAPVGGRDLFSYSKYLDQTEDLFSFTRFDVDLQQYIPIFTPSLALRAHAAGVTPDEGNIVPFYLLPMLGGSHSVRAYPVQRFRDNNSLLLQGEYRFRLNDFMTGALFYDTGKVTADCKDLWNLNDSKNDYGISVRLGFAGIAAFRAEVVWGGDEGRSYALRFSDVLLVRQLGRVGQVGRGGQVGRVGQVGQVGRGGKIRRTGAVVVLLAVGVLSGVFVVRGAAPRFYPDDPLAADNDAAFDAGRAQPRNLSEWYDFARNQFGEPGERNKIRALNINTLDEVPDSSWLTNRIGHRPMTVAEITRGPDIVEPLDVEEWIVTGGKGAAGFQPGFRAVNARDPRPMAERTLYQLELDLEDFPDLATSAEVIGTAIYHAIGYNTVDTYIVNVDPRKVRVAENTVLRDASGRRPMTQRDIDEIFKLGAKNADGTYRMSAGRFVEGRPLGNFEHFGTRPDDPNDIYKHEHRREIRANRVFSSWINHDDSRALNTLDMLVGPTGRQYIKHYMFDFGSVLGSSPERRVSGHEYLFEGKPTLTALATLGLWLPKGELAPYPTGKLYHQVGLIEAQDLEPEEWKPIYPNAAFDNMRPDDAFWAARIVAAFSDEALAAIVAKARYRDQRAADYILKILIERRDKVIAAWLPAVNPLVNFVLASDGTLTFENAAAKLKGATPPTGYVINWSRFDNTTNTHQPIGTEATVPTPTAKAPAGFENSQFVAVAVKTVHPAHKVWAEPVRAYFRREGTGWKTVGLERQF